MIKAILDSGCTSTVCGESWLDCYMKSFDSDEVNGINNTDRNTIFRFGD